MTIFHMYDTKLKKIMISEKWNKWKEPHVWLSQFTMTEEFLGHEARIENASKFLKLRIQGECGASVHKTEYQKVLHRKNPRDLQQVYCSGHACKETTQGWGDNCLNRIEVNSVGHLLTVRKKACSQRKNEMTYNSRVIG